jgi:hypothetical protein
MEKKSVPQVCVSQENTLLPKIILITIIAIHIARSLEIPIQKEVRKR